MYRHEHITATDKQPIMHHQVYSKIFPLPPTESNNPQQVRPEGDPASVYFGKYVAAARCFEQHTRAFDE